MSLLLSILLLCGITVNTAPICSNNVVYDSSLKSQSSSAVEYTPPHGNGLNMYGDVYENNDNPDTATRLVPDDYYQLKSYHTSFDATLNVETLIGDYDYYYLPILTESNVSISILENYNQFYSYNFFIYSYEYNEYGLPFGKATRTDTSIQEEKNPSQRNKYFSGTLKPGTYIVMLSNEGSFNSDIILNYHFDLNVTKSNRYYTNQSVSNLRYAKGLNGAVWMSDYVPVYTGKSINPTLDLKYYKKSDGEISDKDYALDDLLSISNGNRIHLTTYYLWDGDILDVIGQTAGTISNAMKEQFKKDEILSTELKTDFDIANKLIKISGKVINIAGKFTPFSGEIEVATTIFTKVSKISLDYFLEALLPKHNLKEYMYYAYLQKLNGLCQGREQMFGQVVKIPFYYKLKSNENWAPNYVEHSIDFSPSLDELLDEPTNITCDDLIEADNLESCFCRGRIYGIKLNGSNQPIVDFADSFGYKKIIPHELSTRQASAVNNLAYKEFSWYYYTAPKDGKYSFFTFRDSENPIIDTTINVSTNIDYGYNSEDIICSVIGGYYDQHKNETGTYYQTNMLEGETLYFRINGVDYSEIKNSIFQVKENFVEDMPHTHNFSESYSWESLTQHRSYCSCGEFVLEGHVISGSSSASPNGVRYSTCLLCHGRAKFGFALPSGISTFSYIDNNQNGFTLAENGLYYPEKTYIDNGNVILDYNDSILVKNDLNYLKILMNNLHG